MKVCVKNGRLVGGSDIDIDVTKESLEKHLNQSICLDDIEDDVDSFVEQMVMSLNLNLRYGDDRALLALAVVLECLNASKSYKDLDKNLSENTPLDDSSSGIVMFMLCQLEAKGFIHDTKYSQLTEKGKILLWLLRKFEFIDENI